MKIEDKLIIELCKNKKDNDLINSIIHEHKIDLDYLFRIIENHLINPIVLDELLKYPLQEKIKNFIFQAAKQSTIKTIFHNNLIKNELIKIKSVLEDHEIEFLVMKGLSLDFTGRRTIGDIDILIKEDHLILAAEALKKLNFHYVGDKLNHYIKNNEKHDITRQLSWNNQFQFYNDENMLLLELHTNLFERCRAYQINLDILLDNIKCFWNNKKYDENLKCYKFSNEDSLILACMHNAIKRSLYRNSFKLRSLIDISNLIMNGIDWNYFLSSSAKLNISSLVLFSLMLTNRILDTDIPHDVINELKLNCTKQQIFMVNLHLKCYKTLGANSFFYSNLYKILIPFIYQKKLMPRIKSIFLIHLFFPPKWIIAQRFNLKKDSIAVYFAYLLNPLRLIYVMIKNIFKS